jgi:hypothetical protein
VSNEQAYGFFHEVSQDVTLQGQLNHAFALAFPEVLAQIARARGYEVNAEDIGNVVGIERQPTPDVDSEALDDFESRNSKIVEHVVAGDFWADFRRSPMFRRITAEPDATIFNPFLMAAPFRMTIPGPTWVQVMGSEGTPDSEPKSRPSAVELYDSI